MTTIISLALLALTAVLPASTQSTSAPATTFARIETSLGNIDVELDRTRAPITTTNFLEYAKTGYYDRLIFHRVIPGVLIQGGGYSASLYTRAARPPIRNEATNGLKNRRGTIAMARFDDPDSATSQFFINLADNPTLDRTGDQYKKDAGYAVFGKVVAGMDIADAIGAVETGARAGGVDLTSDVPVETVFIVRIDEIAASDVGKPKP